MKTSKAMAEYKKARKHLNQVFYVFSRIYNLGFTDFAGNAEKEESKLAQEMMVKIAKLEIDIKDFFESYIGRRVLRDLDLGEKIQ